MLNEEIYNLCTCDRCKLGDFYFSIENNIVSSFHSLAFHSNVGLYFVGQTKVGAMEAVASV